MYCSPLGKGKRESRSGDPLDKSDIARFTPTYIVTALFCIFGVTQYTSLGILEKVEKIHYLGIPNCSLNNFLLDIFLK